MFDLLSPVVQIRRDNIASVTPIRAKVELPFTPEQRKEYDRLTDLYREHAKAEDRLRREVRLLNSKADVHRENQEHLSRAMAALDAQRRTA